MDHNKLWKILKEIGIPDYLTCLLRNLCAGQEARVRPGHGTMDWFKIGKGVGQGCILLFCLFNLHAEMPGWMNHQLESRLPEEMPATSDMQVESYPKGSPGGSAGEDSACNAGDLGSIPGLGRSPGGGKGCPLQYSGLENSMDYTVHGLCKESDTTQ